MSVLIVKSGIHSTVQDLGRYGMRRYGINPCGVMDVAAARILNIILGNDENSPVIETYFPAAEFVFEDDVLFAIGGADMDATLDGTPVSIFRHYLAQKGSVLCFNKPGAGRVAYLAVRGGLDVKKHFGSSSTCLAAGFGGLDGRKLAAGDRIQFSSDARDAAIKKFAGVAAGLYSIDDQVAELRFIPGPEFDSLTALGEMTLLSSIFTVTKDSDRMGTRTDGPSVFLLERSELASSGVTFGTIQLLPSGQMIILMADHQTTGGYPRIGTIITPDLPRLAQMVAGRTFTLKPVSVAAAEAANLKFQRDLDLLRLGVSFSQTLSSKQNEVH